MTLHMVLHGCSPMPVAVADAVAGGGGLCFEYLAYTRSLVTLITCQIMLAGVTELEREKLTFLHREVLAVGEYELEPPAFHIATQLQHSDPNKFRLVTGRNGNLSQVITGAGLGNLVGRAGDFTPNPHRLLP